MKRGTRIKANLQTTTTIPRRDLAKMVNGLQISHNELRDYYATFGYPEELSYEFYLFAYKRADIATTIVDSYPDATWRNTPALFEKSKKDDADNPFRKKWDRLVKELKLYNYINRVDKLSNIGRYGVLVIGFDDTATKEDYAKPVDKNKVTKIRFLLPRGEESAKITGWQTDPTKDRYGLPEYYNITSQSSEAQSVTLKVHHTRVIHIAERLLEDDVYGMPMLEKVYNRLIDLNKVVGGSAEMFWQGADRAISFEMDSDAVATPDDEEKMTESIRDFVHGYKRFLQLQGVKANVLESSVESPDKHTDVNLQLIAAAARIPKRKLIGSESGENSSDQDDDDWKARVDERRDIFAEPFILRAFVDRCKEYNILPNVDYVVEWPDTWAPSKKEKANIARIMSETIANYARATGAQEIVPVEIFLREFVGMEPELITEIGDIVEEQAKNLLQQLQDEDMHMENVPDFDMQPTEIEVEDRTNPVSEVARSRSSNV